MKKKCLGIWFIVFWSFAFLAKAQPIVPWVKTQSATDSHYVYIGSTKTYIDGIKTNNYAVGAFYDSLGFTKCAGYAIIPKDTALIVYGRGLSTNFSYVEGQAFVFKIWDIASSCEIDSVIAVFFPSSKSTFTKNGFSEIDTLRSYKSAITYSSNSFCQAQQFEMPIIKGNVSNVKYFPSPGLSIDTSSGRIDLSKSSPGNHYIHFLSNTCLVDDTFALEIKPKPMVDIGVDTTICGDHFTLDAGAGFTKYNWSTKETTRSIDITTSGNYNIIVTDIHGCENLDSIRVTFSNINTDFVKYSVIDADCKVGGEILIDSFSIITGGKSPYLYLLKLGSVTFSGTKYIKGIPSGLYSLYVRDTTGCEKLAFDNVVINDKCQHPILVFDSYGNSTEYYISQQGTTKIYDKTGAIVKKFNTPATWDGTDEKGEVVPMGDYLIITNDTDKIRISVIK